MASTASRPLLRLGRIQPDPRLRGLHPGTPASDLVVTAAVPVPGSLSERQYARDVAWNGAVRAAGDLGVPMDTAQALLGASGSGTDRCLDGSG